MIVYVSMDRILWEQFGKGRFSDKLFLNLNAQNKVYKSIFERNGRTSLQPHLWVKLL